MLKIIKEKNKFLRYFNETFKISSGFERFLGSLFLMLMACHLSACLWYMQAYIADDPGSWVYVYRFLDASNFDVKYFHYLVFYSKIKRNILNHAIGLFKPLLQLDMEIYILSQCKSSIKIINLKILIKN